VIFVTLGTHQQPFTRALDALAGLDPAEPMMIQHGATSPRAQSATVTWVDYLATDVLIASMRDARVVISHAGVGSAVTAIRAGKKPVLIPRLARFGEHVDDHQLQLARRFAARELALVFEAGDDICELAAEAERSGPPALRTTGNGLRNAVATAALG
jgi:UDP-N-acetylglucosamine transferase subunit ALG13